MAIPRFAADCRAAPRSPRDSPPRAARSSSGWSIQPCSIARARELEPWLDATPFGRDEFAGLRTRRTGGLLARSATCRELVLHPLVLDTTRAVLAHATSFQLHLTQVIAIGPGEPAQMIHRDQWAFDFFPFPPGYEVQCNTIWAMTDFTEANGATRVIPGSNRREDRLEFRTRTPSPPRCPPARSCSTPARSTTAPAPTVRIQCATASTSPTR